MNHINYPDTKWGNKIAFHFPYDHATKEELNSFLDQYGLLWGFQHELSESGNYHHWQGFLVLKKKTRVGTMRNRFKAKFWRNKDHPWYVNHWADNNAAGIKYVTKEDTFVDQRVVGGDKDLIGVTAGSRRDLDKAARMVLQGKYKQLLEESPGMLFQFPTGMQKAREEYLHNKFEEEQGNTVNMIRIVLTGDAGTGKTTLAFAICKYLKETFGWRTYQPQPTHNNNMYWDGYTDQEVLLMDEYHNNIPLTLFKRMFDSHHVKVPRRGETCAAFWKVAIITSNHSFPDQFYPNAQIANPIETEAIARRFWNKTFTRGPELFGWQRIRQLPEARTVLEHACHHFGWTWNEVFPALPTLTEEHPDMLDDQLEWEEEILEQADSLSATQPLTGYGTQDSPYEI